MANLLNNTESTLSNQRPLKAFITAVGATDVRKKALTNKAGEPVLNKEGKQIVVFMAINGKKEILAQGLVSQKTLAEGLKPEALQVAESNYVDETTGVPKTCLVLFNGIDMLEGSESLF